MTSLLYCAFIFYLKNNLPNKCLVKSFHFVANVVQLLLHIIHFSSSCSTPLQRASLGLLSEFGLGLVKGSGWMMDDQRRGEERGWGVYSLLPPIKLWCGNGCVCLTTPQPESHFPRQNSHQVLTSTPTPVPSGLEGITPSYFS